MATRAATDNTVNERRLRPIYDCLDNGNNKKAVVEADKVLKKQRDSQCAKVLKALALIRLGRQDESEILLDEVHKQAPTDDATLQAMTICYRDLQRVDLLTNVYEQAAAKEPNNEEVLSHLFMAYVRVADYKKQQQTATALYKLRPKNPYYFWSVMSLYMQAVTEPDNALAQKMFLPLAEKKTKKYIDEGKIDAEAEVELYLMILQRQNKFKDMLDVIDGPLGQHMKNHLNFLTRRKAKLLITLGKFKEAFDVYKVLIEHSPDQLEFYEDLYKIALSADADENNGEDFIGQAVELTKKYAERGVKRGSTAKLRGPYLAKILLFHLLEDSSRPHFEEHRASIAKENKELLVEYYKYFGNKLTCYFDLCFVMKKCKDASKDMANVLQTIASQYNLQCLPATLDDMFRQFNYSSLQLHSSSDKLEPSAVISHFTTFVEKYEHSLQFGSNNLPSEVQPADNYCLLIAHLLSNETARDDSTIILLIALLERALIKSPSNHSIKLTLISLYSLIGAVACSLAIYESLEIKHLQQESLGYLIFNPLLSHGSFAAASQLMSNALRFYTVTYKDTYEYLISCYKYGSFTKVEEIIELRESLSKSVQFGAITVEKMLLELLLEGKCHVSSKSLLDYFDAELEKDKPEFEKPSDNRDMKVFRIFCMRHEEELDVRRAKTLESELLWTKMRSLVVRSIACAHYFVENSSSKGDDGNSTTNGTSNGLETKSLGSYVSDLKECWHNIASADTDIDYTKVALIGPPSSRLSGWRKRCHLELIIGLLELLSNLQAGVMEEDQENEKQKSLQTDLFADQLKDLLAAMKVVGLGSLKEVGDALEQLANFLDTISLAVVLLDIVSSTIKPLWKKNRKKSQSSGDVTVMAYFNSLLSCFEKGINDGLSLSAQLNFREIARGSMASDFQEIPSKFLLEPQEYSATLEEVVTKIEKSYGQSLKELGDLLNAKLKYLSTLRLK